MWSTQALAQPAEIQWTLFPDQADKLDELVTDFEIWCKFVLEHEISELNDQQLQAIKLLDQQLDVLTQLRDVWNVTALRENQDWEIAREFAHQVLGAFGWEAAIPPMDRIDQ